MQSVYWAFELGELCKKELLEMMTDKKGEQINQDAYSHFLGDGRTHKYLSKQLSIKALELSPNSFLSF